MGRGKGIVWEWRSEQQGWQTLDWRTRVRFCALSLPPQAHYPVFYSIIEHSLNYKNNLILPGVLGILLLLLGSQVDAPGDAHPPKMCPLQCGARARLSTWMNTR
jgi:hypothetical protein